MSYLVLARKYRPQTFDQVVKQEHVTQTLSNAISSDRVAHAILFSGPRGTGKTTVARILAKAMNCKQGPAPVPCNKCQSCGEITAGSSTDVFEIDGASNNGVDQIRELRENVKYLPAHSPYKIYIIDEVHMLSIAAFNALLKTLEEPPRHVKFFFATTEPHKIPITILSRCQRHDLRRISIESVSDHMNSLCMQEGIDIERKSLDTIARESGGSMRDALSLLDQVMTCSEEKTVPHGQLLDILGIIDRTMLFDTSAAVLRGDISEILEIVNKIHDHGHDVKKFYSELTEHFRNLLVIRMGKKVGSLLDVPSHEIALMAEQIKNVSDIWLSQILDILFKEESVIRFSSQPRLALEMIFVKIFQTKPLLPIDTLIKKLDDLKKGIYENPGAYADIPRMPGVAESARDSSDSPVSAPADIPQRQADGNALPDTHQADQETPADISFNPDDSPEKNWENLIELAYDKSGVLYSNLKKCTLKNLSGQRLGIEVGGNGSHLDRINKHKPILKDICNSFFGKEIDISITTGEKKDNEGIRQQKKTMADLKKEAREHHLVKAATEIFGGSIAEVKILQ